MPGLVGQSLGRYHILEPLGEGGMASVYKAFDTRLETDVAVKVIRTDRFTPEMLAGALKRFEREAKSLARLTHPNIVKVTDYGEYEGQPYLVMEYLPGGTLKERMGRPIPWSEAARTLVPVAHALEFAHQQGIIHRDIKPSNILITKSGEPMLSDFGVAKIIGDEALTGLTGTGMAMGTPEYMAPEQVNAKTADGRADIYALGIVLYEMVTGRRPFEADTPLAVLIKHINDPLPRPSQFVPGLPGAVEKVIFKALAKKPEDRYQTMDEFAAALEKMAANERTSVVSKRRDEKGERKPEDFKKTTGRALPGILAPTAAEQKASENQEDPGNATVPALPGPAHQAVGISKYPDKPVRSLKWLFPLGILIVVLGISIPLGIRYLKPIPIVQAADTATFTQVPAFTPTQTITPTATITPSPTTIFTSTITLTPGFGSTWTRPADGMPMVYVPEGDFTMGSNINDDEKPIHTVYLDAFWIDQTEVTNKMYALCVAAGKCDQPDSSKSYSHPNYYGSPDYDDFPVIYVAWKDASAYCAWAGGGDYSIRLPTEAEWEKAARGTDGRTYPWGVGIDCTKANYYDGHKYCVGDTSRVGSYESGKRPYGAYDMVGNVWEWVGDWYSGSYYTTIKDGVRNPTGPTSGEYRVLRGGAWSLSASYARSANRYAVNPGDSSYDVGFRCSRPDNSTTLVINTPAPATTANAALDTGSTWTRPSDNMLMVNVPVGEFTMGSNNGEANEKPVHKVSLNAFWVDQTEVTNRMYALCVAAGKCDQPRSNSSYTRSNYYGNPDYDDFPVIYVAWKDASAYCAWAGGGDYSIRLPTEAEWEKAARGTDERTFPWGEGIDCTKANYNDGIKNCVGDTSRVGSYESGKSPYGAYDMAGNVWEWVADWYSSNYYSTIQDILLNPTGPTSGESRVQRGGAWSYYDGDVRSANRNSGFPAGSNGSIGFRCSRGTSP